MNRIAPEAVAAWFRDHPDVKPIRHRYALLDGAGDALIGCCGLTSRVVEKPDFPLTSISRGRLAHVLGLYPSYVQGFIVGWDADAAFRRPDLVPERWHLGHLDGRAAYEATAEVLKS